MLPIDKFKEVVSSAPLISIDLIVRNSKNEVLLGKRINKPARGFWFVPGGRVFKDETLELAYSRLLKDELNIERQSAEFKGVYQHFYEESFAGTGFSTHYLVLVYELVVSANLVALPYEQHLNYKWSTENEILNDECVHEYTKWYFQHGRGADLSFTNEEL